MIFGIGIDEVEVSRIEEKLKRTPRLKERLFTSAEMKYCDAKRNSSQHYAARFAAKEAFFKAIGTGWRKGFGFSQIEIINNQLGKPDCVLHGRLREFAGEMGLTEIHVSLTHLKDIAAAVVLVEKE